MTLHGPLGWHRWRLNSSHRRHNYSPPCRCWRQPSAQPERLSRRTAGMRGALYLSLTSSRGGRARHVAWVRVAEKDIDGGVPLWRPDLLVGAPIQSDLVVAGGTMVNAVELGTRGWHPMVTGGWQWGMWVVGHCPPPYHTGLTTSLAFYLLQWWLCPSEVMVKQIWQSSCWRWRRVVSGSISVRLGGGSRSWCMATTTLRHQCGPLQRRRWPP
jgi:hypothetical protein